MTANPAYHRIAMNSRFPKGLLLLFGCLCAGHGADSIPATLDLSSATAYALEHNYAIRMAKERIREQEGMIVEVKASVLPNASIQSSYSRTDESLVSGPNSDQNWSVALQVSQLIYSGGGVSATLDAQRLTHEASLLDLRATVDQVLAQVRGAYYDVILARNRIAVQEQNVRLLEEQLANAQSRFEAQSVSRFDVLRAEVELANAQPPLIRSRNAHRIAVDELFRVIGFNRTDYVGVIPQVVGELDFTPVEAELESALSQALQNRPELLYLDVMRKAREAGVRIARSNYLPNLSVFGGYEWVKDGMSDRVADSNDGWRVGIQSSWAIFDGRATEGRVIQARSQVRQVELQLADQRVAVELEVRRAISSLQEALELTESAGKVVDQAEEALRLADARYNAGSATQLDVLQTRVALTQARTNQHEANYSYLVAESALRKALGETR